VLLLHQIMKHGYMQLQSVSVNVKVGTVKVADDFGIHRSANNLRIQQPTENSRFPGQISFCRSCSRMNKWQMQLTDISFSWATCVPWTVVQRDAVNVPEAALYINVSLQVTAARRCLLRFFQRNRGKVPVALVESALVMEKLHLACPMVKNFWRYVYSFRIHEHDRRTDERRVCRAYA